MTETNLWKMIERMEEITDTMEDIKDYLDQVYENNIAYNNWIQVATESLIKLQKDIDFLKSKKTCI